MWEGGEEVERKNGEECRLEGVRGCLVRKGGVEKIGWGV